MAVSFHIVHLITLTCLLELSSASENVSTVFSIDAYCLREYRNGKTIIGRQNYTVYAWPIPDLTMYTHPRFYKELKGKGGFHIELLGEDSGDERRLSVSWETVHIENTMRISFDHPHIRTSPSDHPDNESLEQISIIQFHIDSPHQVNDHEIRHKGKRRRFKINFDCLKISRGIRARAEVCKLRFGHKHKQICTKQSIDTTHCSCEGVTVYVNESQSSPFGTMEIFYNIQHNTKMSYGILNMETRIWTNSTENIELDKKNRSVALQKVIQSPGNYTVMIKLYCENVSRQIVDQECYSRAFNIIKNHKVTSKLSGASVRRAFTTVVICLLIIAAAVVVFLCYNRQLCAGRVSGKPRKKDYRYSKRTHTYNKITISPESANSIIEHTISEYCDDVSINFQTDRKNICGHLLPATHVNRADNITLSYSHLRDQGSKYSGKKSINIKSARPIPPLPLDRAESRTVCFPKKETKKTESLGRICKESKFNPKSASVCLVKPVSTGARAAVTAESHTGLTVSNGEIAETNTQDIDWGRVFTYIIPHLCTPRWRLFAIQLLSRELPNEDNIDALISRLEQQSKSECGGDQLEHKLYKILWYWKTLHVSIPPNMDDIKDALKDSDHLEILNLLRDWKIPRKPRLNKVQETMKKTIAVPELEFRFEQHSTDVKVLPCFDLKRPLDHSGASKLSTGTLEFDYQFAQRDVRIKKRKFARIGVGNRDIKDEIIRLTESERMCINLICDLLQSNSERRLNIEEYRVYVKFVTSTIQKATTREISLKNIIQLKFSHYEDCERFQSSRGSVMYRICCESGRITMTESDWKFLELYVQRMRSAVVEQFPDSDTSFLFLTHNGEKITRDYIGIHETISTADSEQDIVAYKRSRTRKSRVEVHRKKMSRTSLRMRELSSTESNQESTESNQESTETDSSSSHTGESRSGCIVRRREGACRRRSRTNRLSKKRGKARQMKSSNISNTPNPVETIDYKKLAEALLQKQSEAISQTSFRFIAIDNKATSTVPPEPRPSTSTDCVCSTINSTTTTEPQ